MPHTNMDLKKNKTATVNVFEFTLPKSELDADLTVGEFGMINVPVEVVAVEGDVVTFRKHGMAKADKVFQQEPLEMMRERIGTVEDEEK